MDAALTNQSGDYVRPNKQANKAQTVIYTFHTVGRWREPHDTFSFCPVSDTVSALPSHSAVCSIDRRCTSATPRSFLVFPLTHGINRSLFGNLRMLKTRHYLHFAYMHCAAAPCYCSVAAKESIAISYPRGQQQQTSSHTAAVLILRALQSL